MTGAQGSRLGTMFGPYHLKRLLGRGGMGEVYEAEHTVKQWTVALKLMSHAFSQDPVFRKRMEREARITGRLLEPHVIPIHDYGEIDGQLYWRCASSRASICAACSNGTGHSRHRERWPSSTRSHRLSMPPMPPG